MEHEHLSFPDAVRYLAKKYQIEIEDNQDAYDATQANFRESLYIVNKHAKEHFDAINILGDSRIEEIPEHDGLLTCPPYWNLEKYDNDNGLDRIKKWNDSLVDYEKVWKRSVEKAAPGSKYCIVLGDWRKNKIYYDFVFQTEKIMEKLGMKPFDKVTLSHKKQAKIKIMLPQAKRLGYTVKVHQILLVYEKC